VALGAGLALLAFQNFDWWVRSRWMMNAHHRVQACLADVLWRCVTWGPIIATMLLGWLIGSLWQRRVEGQREAQEAMDLPRSKPRAERNKP
jgi:hypothetical protein